MKRETRTILYGLFITDVEYYTDTNADKNNSEIDYFTGTMLSSKVTLGSVASSSYTYKVTIYNNSDREYVTTIAPGQYLTFPVTFKYIGTNVNNNIKVIVKDAGGE